MSETGTNAENPRHELPPSSPYLDTESSALVAKPGARRLAIVTIGIIFPLFISIGAAAQVLNTAVGLWFTELFVFLGVAWVRVRMSGRDPVRYAGVDFLPRRPALFGFALGAVNFFALVVPIQFLAQRIAPASWRDLYDATHLFKNQTPVELALIVAAVVLAAPFCEEFVFRGVLQQGLMPPTLSRRGAVLLSAAIFSAFHLDPIGFPARFELGLLFGLLFLRTGSLWPGMMAHAANNLVSTALYFAVDGIKPAGSDEPTWGAVAWVSLFGLSALAGLIAVASKSPSIVEADSVEMGRRQELGYLIPPAKSFWSAARPWVAGALVTLGLLVLVDHRGLVLSYYDFRYHLPPLGKAAAKAEKLERDQLDSLRKDARRGKIPLDRYRVVRQRLSRKFGNDRS